jgi:hypothetical protein
MLLVASVGAASMGVAGRAASSRKNAPNLAEASLSVALEGPKRRPNTPGGI